MWSCSSCCKGISLSSSSFFLSDIFRALVICFFFFLIILNNLPCIHLGFCPQGVQLPPHGVAGSFAGENLEAVAGTVSSSEGQISEAKKAYRSGMNKRHNHKK